MRTAAYYLLLIALGIAAAFVLGPFILPGALLIGLYHLLIYLERHAVYKGDAAAQDRDRWKAGL